MVICYGSPSKLISLAKEGPTSKVIGSIFQTNIWKTLKHGTIFEKML